jgi:hypothetical protein
LAVSRWPHKSFIQNGDDAVLFGERWPRNDISAPRRPRALVRDQINQMKTSSDPNYCSSGEG